MNRDRSVHLDKTFRRTSFPPSPIFLLFFGSNPLVPPLTPFFSPCPSSISRFSASTAFFRRPFLTPSDNSKPFRFRDQTQTTPSRLNFFSRTNEIAPALVEKKSPFFSLSNPPPTFTSRLFSPLCPKTPSPILPDPLLWPFKLLVVFHLKTFFLLF